MNPGTLRHVVTLEAPAESTADTGEVLETWQPWAENVRAAIEPITGRERWADSQVLATSDALIRIRYRPGVTERMRVRHVQEVSGSPQVVAYFAIDAVIHVQTRGRELHLACTRYAAEGFRRGRST